MPLFASKASSLLMLTLIVGTAVGTAAYFHKQSTAIQSVACTQEAMQCPDGSYVGRTGPDCTFAACPIVASTSAMTTATSNASPLGTGAPTLPPPNPDASMALSCPGLDLTKVCADGSDVRLSYDINRIPQCLYPACPSSSPSPTAPPPPPPPPNP